MSTKRKIPELAEIEFTGAKSITRYSQEGRGICRDLSFEFQMAADEVYAALTNTSKGHPLLLGVDVKIRARRVRNRLRRAGEHTACAAAELVAFHAQFRKEFADVLRPIKPKKAFDFEEED